MAIELTPFESELLTAIVADYRSLLREYRRHMAKNPKAKIRDSVFLSTGDLAERTGEIPVDLAGWLGRPINPMDSKRASRAYVRLEELGLIKRLSHSWTTRTSAIRVLEAGERAVRKPRGPRVTLAAAPTPPNAGVAAENAANVA